MDNYAYLHLPIEQVVRRTDTRFQAGFATEAKEMFPGNEEYVLAGSRAGLPRVRLIGSVQLQEPVMHVRISLEKRFAESVKAAMQSRAAAIAEEYARSTYCVLRYEAPLARLLGLPAELAALTDGRAKHWTALSHYALVTGG